MEENCQSSAKRKDLMKAACICLLVIASAASPGQTAHPKLNVAEYVSAPAQLETQVPSIVFADFDGDGRDEAVVFYTNRQNPPLAATVLVLKATDERFPPL